MCDICDFCDECPAFELDEVPLDGGRDYQWQHGCYHRHYPAQQAMKGSCPDKETGLDSEAYFARRWALRERYAVWSGEEDYGESQD